MSGKLAGCCLLLCSGFSEWLGALKDFFKIQQGQIESQVELQLFSPATANKPYDWQAGWLAGCSGMNDSTQTSTLTSIFSVMSMKDLAEWLWAGRSVIGIEHPGSGGFVMNLLGVQVDGYCPILPQALQNPQNCLEKPLMWRRWWLLSV